MSFFTLYSKFRSIDEGCIKPMPETISRHVKLDALTLVTARHTKAYVSHLMYISKSTIAYAKRKQQLYGDIESEKKKSKRREKFTHEIINVSTFCPLYWLTDLIVCAANDYEVAKPFVKGILRRNS